jgi:hypothetical protein
MWQLANKNKDQGTIVTYHHASDTAATNIAQQQTKSIGNLLSAAEAYMYLKDGEVEPIDDYRSSWILLLLN